MYTTCLYCNGALGKNEALEEFPVGRRLAFDPKRGRLWVVCSSCERWNLSPLDERFEAIEAAERRFRDSRLRVSTDNVGMARLREGLDLIRIGDPLRPEMAVWRYGDQFGRRRKRQLLITGAAVAAAGLAATSFLWVGAYSAGFMILNSSAWDRVVHGNPKHVVARITPDGYDEPVVVQRSHARESLLEIRPDDDKFRLRLRHTDGEVHLVGEEALRCAAQLLPVVNRFGGSRALVQSSVDLLEQAGDPMKAVRKIQEMHGRVRPNPYVKRIHSSTMSNLEQESYRTETSPKKLRGSLSALPHRDRLALEMALHEERERRAMQGELKELEQAWKEAEEIAAIADNMFTTPAIEQGVQRLRDETKP